MGVKYISPKSIKVTIKMLNAGHRALAFCNDPSATVFELSSADLEAVYIAMREAEMESRAHERQSTRHVTS